MDFRIKVHKCGAVKDRNEIEYISALAQSGEKIRKNGTITVDDVLAFLKSRHGIIVDREKANAYLSDFIGDPNHIQVNDVNAPFLFDMPTLLSIILIPHLLRLAKEANDKKVHEESDYSHEEDNLDSVHDGSGEDIFEQVLEIIFHTMRIPPDSGPPRLTKDLLRGIFAHYDDSEVSDEVLEQMIQVCIENSSDEESNCVVLDRATFTKALTKDLYAYNYKLETNESLLFEDFQTLDESLRKSSQVENEKLQKIYTASCVDMNADTFHSHNFFVLMLWSILIGYFAYFSGDGFASSSVDCHSSSSFFGCRIGVSIADWFYIFILLFGCGCFYLFFISGVNLRTDDAGSFLLVTKQLVGIGMIILFLVLPYSGTLSVSGFAQTRDSEAIGWAPIVAIIFAAFILPMQSLILLRSIFPNSCFWTPECTMKKESNAKLAIRYKVERLCENAIALYKPFEKTINKDSKVDKSSKQAVKRFEEQKNEEEKIGGFRWVYKNLDKLVKEEGVWLSARTIAAHFSHFLAIFSFIFATIWIVGEVHTLLSDSSPTLSLRTESRSVFFNATSTFVYKTSEIDDIFIAANNLSFAYTLDDEIEVYHRTKGEKILESIVNTVRISSGATQLIGLDTIRNLKDTVNRELQRATGGITLEKAVEYIKMFLSFEGNFISFVAEQSKKKVTEHNIKASIIFGAIFGVISMILITLAFCPSSYSQILLARHGSSPSPLNDPYFVFLRKTPLNASVLFGGTLVGCFATGVVIFCIFGSVFFLYIWKETSEYALSFTATLIAITAMVILRAILVQFFQRTFTGFYRKTPAMSNFATIGFESWNISLAMGEIFSRGIKLLLMACLFLGRIDTPFLAPNVDRLPGGLVIDRYPSLFAVDLLLHDSHRHPYLERLGLLYMLKMQHSNLFVEKACSRWRLLFTLALFPWLRPRRVKF